MIVYPAIDIKGGRCVRLSQGRADRETVYAADPAEVARGFRAAGADWVHVVDLDGAFRGLPGNWDALAAVAATGLKVQFGGGMRDRASVKRAFELGAVRVVIGTRAAESAAFVREMVAEFGVGIAVGVDARNGRVAVKGWVDTTEALAADLAKGMEEAGVATLVHTDISTDGMLTGPNFAAQEALLSALKCSIIASGGVSRREDVIGLVQMKKRRPNLDGVIVGKALYERKVDLADLLALAASGGVPAPVEPEPRHSA